VSLCELLSALPPPGVISLCELLYVQSLLGAQRFLLRAGAHNSVSLCAICHGKK